MRTRKPLILINLLLLIALGYLFYGTFQHSAEHDIGRVSVDVELDMPDDDSFAEVNNGLLEPQTDDYDLLIQDDIFGVLAEQRERERRDARVSTDETEREPHAEPLELNLLGTVAGGSNLARAIIQPEGESHQKVYRIGDSVKGAEIIQIERKTVRLRRDGVNYELTMDMTLAIEIDGEEEMILAVEDFKHAFSEEDDALVVDRREFLEQGGGMFAMMRQVQGNIRARPHMENGEVKGLEIAGVDKIGVAQIAGLEEGDVVQSVNGQLINSLPKAMQVFRKARHLDDLSVEILRDGESISKSFKFK